MSNYDVFLKAFTDGFWHAFYLAVLGVLISFDFLLSAYWDWALFYISILLSILSATVYWLFLVKNQSSMTIVKISLFSPLFFVLTLVICFAINLCGIVIFPPIRELGNGDGLFMVICGGYFIVCTCVLRLCVFIAMLIKNAYQSKKAKRTLTAG